MVRINFQALNNMGWPDIRLESTVVSEPSLSQDSQAAHALPLMHDRSMYVDLSVGRHSGFMFPCR